ncbi:MAG: YkvA family protein [Cyanobacteria bacterium J06627_28]
MKKKQNNNSLSATLHQLYSKALKHTKYRWVVILGTLLYLVSPLDISPDVFPVLGWIDDGVIVSLLVTEVSKIMSEELQRKRSATQAAQTIKTEVESVVEPDGIKTISVDAVTVI